MLDNLEIGKMKLSRVLPDLMQIATLYKLKLNRASEFKSARLILVNLYSTDLTYEYIHENESI
jgi:hypothetical protein